MSSYLNVPGRFSAAIKSGASGTLAAMAKQANTGNSVIDSVNLPTRVCTDQPLGRGWAIHCNDPEQRKRHEPHHLLADRE
ncbi:hypothetical protein DENIT_20662 [Pseudomonas veronii]|nr:hypothetical protein DENIT_20662 [Pseudomonas veronii]